jgi:membrane protein implicated in regulation of membrane protease activity
MSIGFQRTRSRTGILLLTALAFVVFTALMAITLAASVAIITSSMTPDAALTIGIAAVLVVVGSLLVFLATYRRGDPPQPPANQAGVNQSGNPSHASPASQASPSRMA